MCFWFLGRVLDYNKVFLDRRIEMFLILGSVSDSGTCFGF